MKIERGAYHVGNTEGEGGVKFGIFTPLRLQQMEPHVFDRMY